MKKYKIPFYGIERFYENNRQTIIEYTDLIFSSGQLLKSKEIDEFENQLAEYCGRKYALTVNNGTDALFFSLKALNLNQGDEVLVTAFSFISSATCILRAGLIPVFVDTDKTTYNIDYSDLKNKISDKTRAIIAVSVFGQTVDYDLINEIIKGKKISIIEDSAQSIGSEYKGKKSGSFGITSCISFDPTKVVGAFGTGGCILTDDDNIYKSINSLRNNGKNEKGEYEILGYNSQISSLQAKLLSWQLGILDDLVDKRTLIAETYNNNLKDIHFISLPYKQDNKKNNYHKFVIRAQNRNDLKAFLDKEGIQTNIHYLKPLSEQPVFKKYIHRANGLESTYELCDEVLSLPIYPELEENEIIYICNKIKEFYKV